MKLQVQLITYKNGIDKLSKLIYAIERNVEQIPSVNATIHVGINDDNRDLELNLTKNQKEKLLPVKSVVFERNLGHGQAHNRLSKLDSGIEYLWILNPDGMPAIDCLLRMYEVINNNGDIGAVEARQLPFDHPKYFNPITFETPWITGACMLVRNTDFQTIGGFDNRFFLHCDDLDLSWRLRQLGKQLKYVPKALFYHDKLISPAGDPLTSEHERLYGPLGALLLAHKYGLKKGIREMTRDLKKQDNLLSKKILQMYQELTRDLVFGECKDNRFAEYYPRWRFSKNRF